MFAHGQRASLGLFAFWWWRHNWLCDIGDVTKEYTAHDVTRQLWRKHMETADSLDIDSFSAIFAATLVRNCLRMLRWLRNPGSLIQMNQFICSNVRAIGWITRIKYRYNNEVALFRNTVHLTGARRPLTPLRKSGEQYHLITQFCLYAAMSKLQNAINIYPEFWRRLTCPTRYFRIP